jgi:hypothetical protein
MQSPTHFVVGAALCRYTKCRPLGLVLAFGSHFVLDALPHFEDPSILPRGMSHLVERVWMWILLMLVAAVLPLGLWAWRRFRRDSGGIVLPACIVAGGLLACCPDYVTEALGREGLIGYWNSASHQTWCPTYYRLLLNPTWRRLIAPTCLLSEISVLLTGFWLLFRHNLVKDALTLDP